MNFLTNWLDQTTMYRVVLYVLIAWVVVSLLLSWTGLMYLGTATLLLCLGVVLAASIFSHYFCAYLWSAPANVESSLITGLILFFVIHPSADKDALIVFAFVILLAIYSKYMLARRKLHVFNPVAIAAVLAALSGLGYATWWVGNPWMLPVVLIGGAIITTKIRRWPLVLSTIVAALLATIVVSAYKGNLELVTISNFFLAWPIVFFATVMVTEPLATPAGTRMHILYGALVGGLSSIPFTFGPVYSSPELALLVGNLAFYPMSLKGRLILTLESVKELARDTYEYSFLPSFPVSFRAGQYLEWTIPHANRDERGIRRYFTIASSPTESDIKLGIKIPKDGSSFKQVLSGMEPGDHIYATSLEGDFVLPDDIAAQPIVMIAGGIGVTPFRSMIQYMVDTKQKRNVTLFNCNKSQADIPYAEIWQRAEKEIGLQLVYVLDSPEKDWQGETGYLTKDVINKYVADTSQVTFYISGPPGMVTAYKKLLKDMGVLNKNIATDFFPGLG